MSQSKNALRQRFKKERDSLTLESREKASLIVSNKIFDHLIARESLSAVFGYLTVGTELDLALLYQRLADEGVPIGIPVVEGEGVMEFYPWCPGERTVKNKFGIEEPISNEVVPLVPDEKTVILIPALAYDERGYRLGYGGGFYDQYLVSAPESKKIGVCYETLVRQSLPREEWDIPVDIIFTDKDC